MNDLNLKKLKMDQPIVDFSLNNSVGLPPKSVAGALLLSVFLGPVGLLYASAWGGLLMIVLGFIVACHKLMVLIILVWLISCVWAVFATNRYNQKWIKNRNF